MAQNPSINLTELHLLISIYILFRNNKFTIRQILRFSGISRNQTYIHTKALFELGYLARAQETRRVMQPFSHYISPKGVELAESWIKELGSYFYTYRKGGRLRRPRKGKVKQSLYDIVREVNDS